MFDLRTFLANADKSNRVYNNVYENHYGIGEYVARRIPTNRHADTMINGKAKHGEIQHILDDSRHTPYPQNYRMAARVKFNRRLSNIGDRVNKELAETDKRKLGVVPQDQIAALTTYAAVRIRNMNSMGQRSSFRQRIDYDLSAENGSNVSLEGAYTQAAKIVSSYINRNGDVQKLIDAIERGDLDKETKTRLINANFGNTVDKEPDTSDGEDGDINAFMPKDDGEDIEPDGVESSYLLDLADFEQYLDKHVDMFESMSTLIDDIPALAITTDVDLIEDDEGDEIGIKQLQLDKIIRMTNGGYAALAMPEKSYFSVLAANEDLQMRQNYRQSEQKHIELVLIDGSGSMASDGRAIRALGYVYNRLNKVIAGRLTVAFALFSDDAWKIEPNGMWIIDNAEDAESAKVPVYDAYVNNTRVSSTRIHTGIEFAYQCAEEMAKYANLDTPVHITVITDEDSSSHRVRIDKRFVVNCLATEDNQGMLNLCKETGGIYMPLNMINVA